MSSSVVRSAASSRCLAADGSIESKPDDVERQWSSSLSTREVTQPSRSRAPEL